MLRYILPLVLSVVPVLADVAKWESEVVAFEKAPLRKGGIVFTGSSTIRLWKSLEKDFEGLPVINRGFGGSQLRDSVDLGSRIVIPHEPRMVVLFAGTNDIAAKKTADDVFRAFEAWVALMREKLPKTELCFIEITTSPSRWEQRETVLAANALIRPACEKNGVKFIPMRENLLGEGGKPREELFAADRLHLNADGYKILADAVRPFLPAK
jgi:lysophospholipase L1-like esterase